MQLTTDAWAKPGGAAAALALAMTGFAGPPPATAQRVPQSSGAADNSRGSTDLSGDINRLRIRGLLRPDLDTPEGLRIYSAMMVNGRCLAGIGRKSFTELFDGPVNSPSERRDIAMLQSRMTSCMSANQPDIVSLTRGTVSESLYHRAGDKQPVDPLPEADIVAFEKAQRPRLATLYTSDLTLALVTDCLVARQPEQTRQVLMTQHGTRAEEQVMDALFAGAPQCASAQRPTNISRPFLRAFIANSAFRLMRWRAKEANPS